MKLLIQVLSLIIPGLLCAQTNFDFTANIDSGCAPLCVVFTDLSVSSKPVKSWLWDFGDGTTSTSQNNTHCFTSTGNYTIKLTLDTGKMVIITKVNYIYVEAFPSAKFSFSPKVIYNNNTPVSFTDQSTGLVVAWYWLFGDGSTSTLKNPTHVYANPGKYTVALEAETSLGCYDTTSSVLDVISGIDEIPAKHLFSIGPNPSTDGTFLITLPFAKAKTFISVNNLLGQCIKTITTERSVEEINLSGLAPSAYFITVKQGSASSTQKIIISQK